mmetsp:Transcript_12891/g.27283  ORF Transcript_12891/g.27283 Transcript_12891/m.27283 type:complete len:86 (-) Transcript_12891:155-412(-)
MAYPRSLGQVINFSKNLFMLFIGSGMIASNGWSKIQIQEHAHAMGHARKTRTTSQITEKKKLFFDIVNFYSRSVVIKPNKCYDFM